MMRFAGMPLRIKSGLTPLVQDFPEIPLDKLPSFRLDEREHVGLFPLDVSEKGRLNFFHVALKAGEEFLKQ